MRLPKSRTETKFTLKDIASKYPNQFLPANGTTPVTVFAHCGLILALHAKLLRSVYPRGFAGRARNLWKISKWQVQYEFFYLKVKVRFMPVGGMPLDTPSGIENGN